MKPRIKEIRENRGLLQKFVAEKIGVKQQQLSRWESGKEYPRIDRAYKLAKVLGVEVNVLYVEEVNHELFVKE